MWSFSLFINSSKIRKMKIKVKYHNQNCKIESFGDWIDLKAAEAVHFKAPISAFKSRKVDFDSKIIKLGISMHLPKYFEANIVPRSSTFKKYGLISANHFGVIDNEYCGNNDIWGFPAIALRDTTIEEGDRICQFRIRPSQKAPWYVKLKWLLVSEVEFVEVDDLGNKNRGGFGSTGKK